MTEVARPSQRAAHPEELETPGHRPQVGACFLFFVFVARLGMGEAILAVGDGYLLDPKVPCRIADEGDF